METLLYREEEGRVDYEGKGFTPRIVEYNIIPFILMDQGFNGGFVLSNFTCIL